MKTKSAHLAGPWAAQEDHGSISILGYHSEIVAMIPGDDDDSVDKSRLIAAAPDLLEALKGMLNWARRVKEQNPGMEIATALNAIARATGKEG